MTDGSSQDEIDIRVFIKQLLDRWYYFAIAFVVIFSLVAIKIQTSKEVFEIGSVMKLRSGSSHAEMILESATAEAQKKNIEDEIVVIKSSDYFSYALGRLDFGISFFMKSGFTEKEFLSEDFSVSVLIDSSTYQISGTPIYIEVVGENEFELRVETEEASKFNLVDLNQIKTPPISIKKKFKFNEPIKEDHFSFRIIQRPGSEMAVGNKFYFTINHPNSLVKRFLKKVEVSTSGRQSNIVNLTTKGSNIKKEKRFLNTLMDVIQQKNLDDQNAASNKTIEFIDAQLAYATVSLSEAERDLESAQYASTDIGETSMLYEQRDRFQADLANLKLKLNVLNSAVSSLENTGSVSDISGSSNSGVYDQVLVDLIIKLNDLQQRKVLLRRGATEANPAVQRINLEIKTTSDALQKNLLGTIDKTELAISDMQSRLNEAIYKINRLPSAIRRELGVTRKFEFNENTYDMFLQRKGAAALTLATNSPDWQVIEKADLTQEGPVSPNKLFFVMLGFISCLVIPAGLVIGENYLNDKIKDRHEIEAITEIPVIGVLAKNKTYSNLESANFETRSMFIETVRDLEINLKYLLGSNGSKVVGITSSTSGEGKTFCAVNLASVIARTGKKVLLIDADMRNSNMAAYFKIGNQPKGLSEFLRHQAELNQVTIKSKIENLSLIYSGSLPTNPMNLLSSKDFKMLIEKSKENYDFVIVDSPPLGLVSDYLVINEFLDAGLYITRFNFSKKEFFDKVNKLYETNVINNMHVVLNGMKMSNIYGSKKGMSNYFEEN